MHHANQVTALGKLHVEAEAALGVGLGARLFLHSVQQPQQDDLICDRRLAGALIAHRTGNGVRGGSPGGKDKTGSDPEKNECSRAGKNILHTMVHFHSSYSQTISAATCRVVALECVAAPGASSGYKLLHTCLRRSSSMAARPASGCSTSNCSIC